MDPDGVGWQVGVLNVLVGKMFLRGEVRHCPSSGSMGVPFPLDGREL